MTDFDPFNIDKVIRKGFRIHRGLVDAQGNRALYCRSKNDGDVTLNQPDYELVVALAEKNGDRSYSLLFHNEYGAGWLRQLDDIDPAEWLWFPTARAAHLGPFQRIAACGDILELGPNELREGSRDPLPPGSAAQLVERADANSPF